MVYVLGIIATYMVINYIVTMRNVYKLRTSFIAYEKAVTDIVSNVKASHQQAELLGSVKERFKHFQVIAAEQHDLISQVDRPSASAAHSKHKNKIVGELRALEEQKREILKTILNDGVDVHISMMDSDGTLTKILISELLNGDIPSPEKTESNNPPKVVRKLQLVKEENNDESSGSETN
jgi:hypothetical protein